MELNQVGIVGRTGAGKSSILNVLFRLNPVSSGIILVDGLNITAVPVRDLRSKIAIVPQSPFLFEGKLRYESITKAHFLSLLVCLSLHELSGTIWIHIT